MNTSRVLSALLACAVTTIMVSFPRLGPSSDRGAPMDLSSGQTPARIQFARMLAALNSGDRATIDRYRERDVSPHWPHAPTTDMTLGWFKRTGGHVELHTQDVAPNYLITLLRNVDSDDLFVMGVQVERDQPHRLIHVSLNYAGNVPDRFRPQQLSDQAAAEELRAHVEHKVSAGKFSGAVLVRRDDRVLFREAYGYADHSRGIPNTADTRFRIGQLTNMFTAVALLRLAQDGRLRITDPVRKWLPELDGEDVGDVRIDQLLANSGGTDDVEHLGWRSASDTSRNLDDLVDEFGDASLVMTPGRGFRYSSLGFLLLASVVERASGQSYAAYVRDVVFRPAGMTSSDFSRNIHERGRAHPYRRPPGEPAWTLVSQLPCCHGSPIGDGYSTVDDIARFLTALHQGRLLDQSHTRQMLEPRIFMWGRAYQAYGVAVERYDDGNEWLTYEDGIEGQNGGFMFRPSTGHLVVVLGNFDAPTAIQVCRHAGARLPYDARPFEMKLQMP